MQMQLVIALCIAWEALADLRMASRPKEAYKLRNEGGAIPFVVGSSIFTEYMEPSTFEYKGLEQQKQKNYDQFLRSNIDNEQDNRNFQDNEGRDHLPFRSFEAGIARQEGPSKLTQTIDAGKSLLVPLRWNNPHSSELEANIWITSVEYPVVVPIKKPTCSGEGYQDNIFKFTIPTDFGELGQKIPGFTGCTETVAQRCVLQVYSHSVESRTYSIGIPIVIKADYGTPMPNTAQNWASIEGASQDPGMAISEMRRFCLESDKKDATGALEADIKNAVPRMAKLFSDVYNHAYMNSDFSPYQGQQHEAISQNLQAAAINKMVTGNRGELGKAILPNAMKDRIKALARQENKVYKAYEALANKIINRVAKNEMKETGTVTAGGLVQNLQNCFRCGAVGSTNTNRLQTNTYIPSFALDASLVQQAAQILPNKYKQFIEVEAADGSEKGKGYVMIYTSALATLSTKFQAAANSGIVYQAGAFKTSLATMPDATQFKKRTATNGKDNGKYAATQAMYTKAKEFPGGCAQTCFIAQACIVAGYEYSPLNMAGQGRTSTVSAAACQTRCANTLGCGFFSWWEDGGCHIQATNAVRKSSSYRVHSGPKVCPQASAPVMPAIKQDSSGTSVTGACAGCALLFKNLEQNTRPAKPVPPTQPPLPISGIIGTGAAGADIVLPDLGGADKDVPDYPDEDGSPREGRPSDPPTTTTTGIILIVYRGGNGANGASPSGVGGVVGAASSCWPHGSLLMLLAVLFTCTP
jgi:hypothetical protein